MLLVGSLSEVLGRVVVVAASSCAAETVRKIAETSP